MNYYKKKYLKYKLKYLKLKKDLKQRGGVIVTIRNSISGEEIEKDINFKTFKKEEDLGIIKNYVKGLFEIDEDTDLVFLNRGKTIDSIKQIQELQNGSVISFTLSNVSTGNKTTTDLAHAKPLSSEDLKPKKGKFKLKNGNMYEGNIVSDMPHGYGKEITEDGEILFEGEWINGKSLGKGKGKIIEHDRVYVGEMFNFKPHGKGKETGNDGSSFEGNWENGYPIGKGEGKIITNFGVYEGDLMGLIDALGNSVLVQHGVGILRRKDKSIKYIGMWLNGLQHGQGTEILEKNVIYVGNWNNGKREGQGIQKLSDELFLELNGTWRDDNFVEGTVTYKDGTIEKIKKL